MSVRHLDTGKWVADVTGADGRRRRRHARTKKQAEQLERGMLNDRDQGIVPMNRRITLGEYIQTRWTPTVRPAVRAQTWNGYARHVRLYIQPMLGRERLSLLDPPRVQRFLHELGELKTAGRPRLAPASIRRIYATLHTIVEMAAGDGLARPLIRATRTRKTGISLPREQRVTYQTPTAREIHQLTAACDPRFRPAVLLAGFCGLRWGEIFALRVVDVGWDMGTIRVHRVLEQKTGRIVEETKGGLEERTIPAPDVVMWALRAHVEEHEPRELLFERAGEPIAATWFHRVIWHPARVKARVPIRFHDLRHACASLLAEQGASAKEVQEHLGHSTPEFTLSRYTHLWPDSRRRTKQRLDQAAGQAERTTTNEREAQ